jgi:hypothetical protein
MLAASAKTEEVCVLRRSVDKTHSPPFAEDAKYSHAVKDKEAYRYQFIRAETGLGAEGAAAH